LEADERVQGVARGGERVAEDSLPGLVVCGGFSQGGQVAGVWRLDMATMRWELTSALVAAREHHACCAVRGTLVVLGGQTSGEDDHIR
jgi:hypothetical protein